MNAAPLASAARTDDLGRHPGRELRVPLGAAFAVTVAAPGPDVLVGEVLLLGPFQRGLPDL